MTVMHSGFDAALNNLQAGRFEWFCAWLFGKRETMTDQYGITVTLLKWRDKLYISRVHKTSDLDTGEKP